MSDSPVPLSLSAKGLQRLEDVNHERDFAFLVGGERYSCPSFVAEFLSPRIASLRSQDLTIQEFSIQTEDSRHLFGAFLSIGFGHAVSVSMDELSFVRSVCGELWNHELFENTLKRDRTEITEDELRAELQFLSGADGCFAGEIGDVASHFYELSHCDFDKLSPTVLESILGDPSLVVQDEDSPFEIVHRLASANSSYFGLLEFVRFEYLSADCMARAFEFISSCFESFTFGIWSTLQARLALSVIPPSRPSRVWLPDNDSKIISRIPKIFSAFREKAFRLLYRGSRDSFGANDFHRQCNGHSNTITLISTKNHCIFGGYTPLTWSSRDTNNNSTDSTLSSFVFTIKNPHNLPPRIFRQKQNAQTIFDHSTYGSTFGNPHDFYVCDQCHTSTTSYSNLGQVYINDTGIAGNQVLTGGYSFTVEEIEVFEVV
jgi:hypothetical protein